MPILPSKSMLLGIIGLGLLTACNSTKFLEVGELLLVKNQVVLEDKLEKVENRSLVLYELNTLFRQPANKEFLFVPREWIYLKAQRGKKTSKFKRWIGEFMGEKPAIFDEKNAIATAEAMTQYFKYKGYHNAEVYYETAIKNQRVELTYLAIPKKQFKVDSVFFESPDDQVDSLLQVTKNQSFLKKGTGLEGKTYEFEKERITNALRNEGYAFFSSTAFPAMEVDTTASPKQANVYFQVLPPPDDTVHQRYRIGQLIINLHYFPQTDLDAVPLKDSLIDGAIFRDTSFDAFYVSPQAVLQAVTLRPNQLYQEDLYQSTNRQLNRLGVFKFVRMRVEPDPLHADLLDVVIELSPNPRFAFGVDFDLNFTNRSTSAGTGNLFGVSLTPSLRNRNLGGEATNWILQIRAGVEFNPRFLLEPRAWNTIDLGIQNEWRIPRFRDYLGLWKMLYRQPMARRRMALTPNFYGNLRNNAPTRFGANVSFISYLDFLSYLNLTASYGYELQPSPSERYQITHLGIDYLRPQFGALFDQQSPSLQDFLSRSLSEQLSVSLLFRGLSWAHTGVANRFGEVLNYSLSFETAGAELWAGNLLFNALANRQDTLRLGSIDFFQYIRLDTEWRYTRQFTPKTAFASRFAFTLAAPFGFSVDVPYIKQPFVGGPNSIRGWRVRGLGPGGFIDSLAIRRDSSNVILFQTGNLRLEANFEYRFKIYSRLNGALFVDLGNVWTLRNDPTRPGSQFLFEASQRENPNPNLGQYDPFYRQIAIGSGFGLRLDLTYFVLRTDLGIKIRYPYRWNGQDFWNPPSEWLNNVNLNLFLGLPF